MITTMGEMLPMAADAERVLSGFNVFGYEDALAVVRAG